MFKKLLFKIKNRNKLTPVSSLGLKVGDAVYDFDGVMWVTEVTPEGSVRTVSVTEDEDEDLDRHHLEGSYLCVRIPERDGEILSLLQSRINKAKSMLETLCSGLGVNPAFIQQKTEQIQIYETWIRQIRGAKENE